VATSSKSKSGPKKCIASRKKASPRTGSTKSGGSPVSARDEQRLAWVRQLVEWQRDMTDPNEFLSTLKIDLYPEEVYTFTPKGKVVVVPRDGTPIDFAYTIHTEVGNTCVGARVNGRMVPLRTKLRNGDIVEVITQNGHTPSRDWLTFVKSPRVPATKFVTGSTSTSASAPSKLAASCWSAKPANTRSASRNFEESDYARVAADYSVATPNDLCGPPSASASIPRGKSSTGSRLGSSISRRNPKRHATPSTPGADAIRRVPLPSAAPIPSSSKARTSCSCIARDVAIPIRGEEIIGYVTRGKGVAVHARSCPNVQNLLYEADRRIAVEWARTADDSAGAKQTYPVKLHRALRRPRRHAQGNHR
jgi:guanosine-3',5'-bis(diphosphate) 3'-pyrophosphohydrolase